MNRTGLITLLPGERQTFRSRRPCAAQHSLTQRAPFAAFLDLANSMAHRTYADMEDCVRRIAEPVSLMGDIRALSRDPRALTDLAKRSYVHGNGFVKLELARHQQSKLRLHVWFPGAAAEENIHDHRWSFASYVLAGTLCSEEFADDPSGAFVCEEYRYTARSGNHAPFKEPVGVSRLSRTVRSVRPVGTSYVMHPLTLHRICSPGNSYVATLVFTAPPMEANSRLLVERDYWIEPVVTPKALEPSAAIETLESVLTSIRTGGSQ